MKARVTSCAVLAFALTTTTFAAPKNASPATLSKAEIERRKESEAIWASQDKKLKQAEKLVAEKKLTDAIKVFEDVYYELELEVGSVKSWKAQARMAEVKRQLDAVKKAYASQRLDIASKAFDRAEYNNVITLCDEVIKFCPPLQAQAQRLKNEAIFRQRGDERRAEMSAERAYPDIIKDETEIAKELAAARTLIRHRKFDAARRKVEAVYKINPFNAEAAYLANVIFTQYYTQGYYRHKADTLGMLAYEAWQWVEPVFYHQRMQENVTEGEIKGATDHATQEKLNKIIFPRVSLDETDITGVISYLRNNKKYDTDGGEGVLIDFETPTRKNAPTAEAKPKAEAPSDDLAAEGNPPADGAQAPKPAEQQQGSEVTIPLVTLHVRNVTLRELLDYICFLTNLNYTVLKDRVVIGSGVDVKTETFDLSSEAASFITQQVDGIGPAVEGGEAPAPAGDGGESGGSEDGAIVGGTIKVVDLNEDKLKEFFKAYGIDFDSPGSSISYKFGKLSMNNTEPNLRRLQEVLTVINTAKPMVQIELKSIEISDTDMKELGFTWSLGAYSKSSDNKWIDAWQGENAVGGGMINVLRNTLAANEGTGSTLLQGLNIFPNLLGSFEPFGSDIGFDLSLTINALDRSDRAETVSAPSITVMDRKTAKAFLGRSYYFPDDWDELEVEVETSDNSNPVFTITTPTPTFADAENIGTDLTVTAKINKGRIINLSLHPKFTAFIGEESYYMKLHQMVRNSQGGWSDNVAVFRIWKPIITTRELDINIDVRDGETVVIGALSDSNISSRRDKIPILGDLPLIGRFFQSTSERAIHKSMLFFVTARLIDDRGVPVHHVDGSGGIPDLRQ